MNVEVPKYGASSRDIASSVPMLAAAAKKDERQQQPAMGNTIDGNACIASQRFHWHELSLAEVTVWGSARLDRVSENDASSFRSSLKNYRMGLFAPRTGICTLCGQSMLSAKQLQSTHTALSSGIHGKTNRSCG